MYSSVFKNAKATLFSVVLLLTLSIPCAASASPSLQSGAGEPDDTIGQVYAQSPDPAGGILWSSLRDPDGSSNDNWVWDNFQFTSNQVVSEVRWWGVYNPGTFSTNNLVKNFVVEVYASIPSGSEPDRKNGPLLRYKVGNNAAETGVPAINGVKAFYYTYTLPTPFTAAAGEKYWLQIEAYQAGFPNWGLAKGTGGDSDNVFYAIFASEGHNPVLRTGDVAFQLWGPSVPPVDPPPIPQRKSYLPLVSLNGGQ